MDALIKFHRDYFAFILDTVAVENHCVGYSIFFVGVYQLPLTVVCDAVRQPRAIKSGSNPFPRSLIQVVAA